MLLSLQIKAQDSTAHAKPLYHFTMGFGIGGGYPQQEGTGIGGSAEFAVQKNKSLYALGFTGVTELGIFRAFSTNVGSLNLSYGRAFKKPQTLSTVSAGIGFITAVERGAFIQSGSILFISIGEYQKIRKHGIGVPLSAKAFWLHRGLFHGLGAELYANINSVSNFYGINLSRHFGKIK